MGLSPKEIRRQMQEADKIRAMKEIENWGKERGEMQDRAGRAVQSACDDIYRRVFEEGWYGRTIFDVVYERQQPANDNTPAPQAANDNSPGAQKANDNLLQDPDKVEEQKEIEDMLKAMYGTGQEADDIPQQGYSHDQGMGY